MQSDVQVRIREQARPVSLEQLGVTPLLRGPMVKIGVLSLGFEPSDHKHSIRKL